MRKLRLKGNKRHVQGCTANKTVFLLSFTISPLTTFKERKRFLLQRKEISTAREVQDVERSIKVPSQCEDLSPMIILDNLGLALLREVKDFLKNKID